MYYLKGKYNTMFSIETKIRKIGYQHDHNRQYFLKFATNGCKNNLQLQQTHPVNTKYIGAVLYSLDSYSVFFKILIFFYYDRLKDI